MSPISYFPDWLDDHYTIGVEGDDTEDDSEEVKNSKQSNVKSSKSGKKKISITCSHNLYSFSRYQKQKIKYFKKASDE